MADRGRCALFQEAGAVRFGSGLKSEKKTCKIMENKSVLKKFKKHSH